MTDRGCHQLDLASGAALTVHHVIEISLHQVNLRLSYHDLKMFQRILASVPWLKEEEQKPRTISDGSADHPANVLAQVERLCALGFTRADCLLALRECSGRLDDAALWLTHNAIPLPSSTVPSPGSTGQSQHIINCQAVEIKTGSVNLVVIDDCGDCDVPLLEISLLHLSFKQDRNWTGFAGCALSVNYYNRFLSGWEPFIEPWLCTIEWNKKVINTASGGARLSLQLKAEEAMQINITSSLLELFRMVKSSWTDDYYNRDRGDAADAARGGLSGGSPVSYRRRSPFIPFSLFNQTGLKLSFSTFTAFTHGGDEKDSFAFRPHDRQKWEYVSDGETVPFSFDSYRNAKLRHGDTHEHKMHQIGVSVAGWHPVGPITVDKVGTFFRMATPMDTSGLPSARIVVKVSLAGYARKLVTVRSALLLHNALPIAVEARLENLANRTGGRSALN